MLVMRQTAGITEPIVAAFLGIFSWDYVRETNISEALSMAGVSSPASHGGFQAEGDSVSSFLKDRHVLWMRWLEKEIEARFDATGAGLEVVADVLRRGFDDPQCFGLVFMTVACPGEAVDED